MKRPLILAYALIALLPALAWAAALPDNVRSATAFIVEYDARGAFLGWGSGFYVDEGIVVTNKHVIEGADSYRVYATGPDDAVNLDCYRSVTKADMKINLDDDVAYIRAYLPCAHGVMDFADDPWTGDPVSVVGYPFRGSVSASLSLSVTSGSVLGTTSDGWLATDAHLDVGNSGGPVVNDSGVLGVAVAKGVTEDGRYLEGYFIPSSVILKGLLYANDSGFGYVPRTRSSSSRRVSSSSASSVARSSSSFSSRAVSSSRSVRSASSRRSSKSSASRRPPVPALFPDVPRSHPAFVAVASLATRGVIGGYPDGTFRPEGAINRAEFVQILVAVFGSDALIGETGCFLDVAHQWFASAVCAARRQGWIVGYPNGTFGPARNVNRAEALKTLITVYGAKTVRGPLPPGVPPSAWFARYVKQGVEMGLVDATVPFRPGEHLTRAEAAVWIDVTNTAAR